MFFMALSFRMWKDAFFIALLKKKMTVIAQHFECILLLNMFFFNLYLKCIVLTYNVTWSPEPSVNWHFLEMFTHVKTAKLPVYCLGWYQFKWLHIPVADPGEGHRGPAPPPLLLDQTEAQRAENVFFEPGPSLPPPLLIWRSRSTTVFPMCFKAGYEDLARSAKLLTSREI